MVVRVVVIGGCLFAGVRGVAGFKERELNTTRGREKERDVDAVATGERERESCRQS